MGENFDINKVVAELLQKNADKIKDKALIFYKDNYKKFLIDFNLAFKDYLKNTYEKYSKVKTLLYKAEPKPLYSFFECCSLKLDQKIIDANDVNNVLDQSKFSIIQGTGGIGKSTLLKHFFINELNKKDLIPLFFELKNLEMNEKGLLSTLYDTLHNLGFKLEFEYFQYALESGIFLILLDGYDELSEEKVKIFTGDLENFCDMFGENYYIMTSRPTNEFINFQRFFVFEACPFSKDQAINLINKIEYENEVKERFVRELNSHLYDTHTSFASIPLLLNMMFLTYDDYAEIPEKIHIFYSNAFETMYQKHDATKGTYKREMKSGLCYDEFKLTFAKFCFISYMKNMLEFTWNDLYDLIKVSNNSKDFNTFGFISDLKDALCVLILEGTKYKFVHRSFQEYFSAFYLKEIDDDLQSKFALKMIEQRRKAFRADAIFPMLFEMSQERFEKNIIIPTLKDLEKDKDQSDKYHLYLSILANTIGLNQRKKNNDEFRITISVVNVTNYLGSLFFIVHKYTTFNEKLNIEGRINNYVNIKGLDVNKRITFSFEEIISDELLLNLVEDSWIGEYARFFANCIDMLDEKHRNSFDVFKELISS